MGSTNMDVISTGDIGAQLHNPKWFVDHKHMLRPNQTIGVLNELGYSILKVPQSMHQPPQAFSPREWRFGLHNRENLDSSGTEAFKLGLAVQYGLTGDKWVNFCDAIVDDPKAMLVCYGLHDEVTTWTEEQIKHVLALDALFLATYLDLYIPSDEKQLWTSRMFELLPFGICIFDMFWKRYHMQVEVALMDLCRVENQIPFVLIDKVVDYISNYIHDQGSTNPFSGDPQYPQKSLEIVVDKTVSGFMNVSYEAFENGRACLLDEKTHILGVAYKVICGLKGLHLNKSIESICIHVSSATKLKQSGIKIVGVDGPLCTMSYKKNCLHLPKMRIFDDTIFFIRNMVWYEGNDIIDNSQFRDYIDLMLDLIQAPEDLDLLIKHDVVFNACGIRVFEMWKALDQDLIQGPFSETHYKMKVDIVKRCDRRRYRLWSEFLIIFCSKPWFVLSTIAIVLVTMATLVQTYTSIIGSNKMKPKFP